MSLNISVKQIEKGINRTIEGYLDRANSIESYLNRVVVDQYRIVQRKRWMTENASEGQRWESLNPDYARAKLTRFKSYEGAGTKMLIATGKLYKSVIGPGTGFRKITTPRSLTISTTNEYAEHVDEVRTFTLFSRETWNKITQGIYDYIVKNKIDTSRAF